MRSDHQLFRPRYVTVGAVHALSHSFFSSAFSHMMGSHYLFRVGPRNASANFWELYH